MLECDIVMLQTTYYDFVIKKGCYLCQTLYFAALLTSSTSAVELAAAHCHPSCYHFSQNNAPHEPLHLRSVYCLLGKLSTNLKLSALIT